MFGGYFILGKRKYSSELKMEIVHAILNNRKSIDEIAQEHKIHKANISKWIAGYKQNGIAGVERDFRSYTPDFKLQVVEDMRANKLSYRAAAAKYNIGMHTTIKQWERIYLEEGYEGLKVERRGRASQAEGCLKGCKPILRKEIYEDLIAENQRLKMENEYLKKLNALILTKEK